MRQTPGEPKTKKGVIIFLAYYPALALGYLLGTARKFVYVWHAAFKAGAEAGSRVIEE